MIGALFMMLSFGNVDAKFCPLDPAPKQHMDNIGIRVDRSGKLTNEALSAEVAARLVDTTIRAGNNTIGWLFLDERGTDYVILKPHVRQGVYAGFGMKTFNHHNPNTYTEAKVQSPLLMPFGVEVRSCTQTD